MATTSAIDATVPADNVQASKADLRANFLAAYNEITDLIRKTRLPYQVAFGLKNLTDS